MQLITADRAKIVGHLVQTKLFLWLKDETVVAEVCTPSLVPRCEPVMLAGTKVTEKEKCLQITRTVCTQTTGVAGFPKKNRSSAKVDIFYYFTIIITSEYFRKLF